MAGRLLVRGARPEKGRLVERAAEELQADGQTPGEAAGERQAGEAGQVRGHGEDVGQVHLQRVAGLLAEAEGRAGRRRRGDSVAGLERGLEVAPDERAHLLGAEVVGVVVARRERERAEDDPALDLRPEAEVARLAVEALRGRASPARAGRSARRRSGRGCSRPRRSRRGSRSRSRAAGGEETPRRAWRPPIRALAGTRGSGPSSPPRRPRRGSPRARRRAGPGPRRPGLRRSRGPGCSSSSRRAGPGRRASTRRGPRLRRCGPGARPGRAKRRRRRGRSGSRDPRSA